ncbi:MAG: putative RND superfamily exporter protein [Hyphomicrobiaceae bacterium]|jgi:predicted RND superfamily exporter protein
MCSRTPASELLYRWRWLISAVVLAAIVSVAGAGFGRLGTFSAQVDTLREQAPEEVKNKPFDARYDIWFDPDDPGLQLYKRIEDQFSAEDFVLVSFEETKHPLGVFSPKSLSTIAELTERIEKIPFVRHVRSLTSNPWIRWGTIDGDGEGLLITDLFANDPDSYDEATIIERMIAVLGAERAARILGQDKVRALLGAEANFADHIGEPRLIGNVISDDGHTTALQVQVLRPIIDKDKLAEAFGEDEHSQIVGGSMHGNHAQWEALTAIETIIAEHGNGYDMHVAGMPTIERNFMVTGEKDMGMAAWMFLMIIIVMVVLFRRVTGVVTPLVIVMASVIGMLGTVFLMGDLLNNITAGAINMVTAVSIADSIHLVASYYALRHKHTNKHELITEVISINAMPVFLTSVTTAIGFYSLTAGNIIPLQMLGYTAGLGTVLAYITSMTLVPALLSLAPLPKAIKTSTGAAATSQPAHWAAQLTDRVLARRVPITITAAVVTILAVIGLLRIELDSNFRTMFPDSNKTMVDTTWIEQRLGGSGDLEIVFQAPAVDETQDTAIARQARIGTLHAQQLAAATGEATALTKAETDEFERLQITEADHARRRIAVSAPFLNELLRFTDRLRSEMTDPESDLHMISRLDGALDILRKMNQVQNQDQAAFYRPPNESDVSNDARTPGFYVDEFTDELELVPGQNASTLAAQYFLQYENGAKPAENLATLVSIDRRTFRVQGRVRQGRSKLQDLAFKRLRNIAETEFPTLTGSSEQVDNGEALATMTLSGKALLYAGMTEKFSYSFIFSMTLALCLIILVIMVIFRSVMLGLVSIVPNVLPIVVPIGMFGLFGVPVDGPAVFVSSVALGVATDDTIHLLTKFTRARRRGLNTADALREALTTIGNALTFTTLILVLGFSVLMFSEFAPNSMMGKLAAVMIALAWLADFLVTPAILALLPDPNAKKGTAKTNLPEPVLPAAS